MMIDGEEADVGFRISLLAALIRHGAEGEVGKHGDGWVLHRDDWWYLQSGKATPMRISPMINEHFEDGYLLVIWNDKEKKQERYFCHSIDEAKAKAKVLLP